MKRKIFFILGFMCTASVIFAAYGQTSLVAGVGSYWGDGNNAPLATFNGPVDTELDPVTGDLYVADTQNHVIRKISSSGLISTVAGSGTAGYAEGIGAAAKFNQPYGICLDQAAGLLYVADTYNYRIRAINLATGQTFNVAGSGASGSYNNTTATSSFYYPRDVTVDKLNNCLYVADTGNSRIRKIDLAAGTVSNAVTTSLNSPFGIVIDSQTAPTKFYVADTYDNRIMSFTVPGFTGSPVAGTYTASYLEGVGIAAYFYHPYNISLDAANNRLFVADYSNNKIRAIDLATKQTSAIAGGGPGTVLPGYVEAQGEAARMSGPGGVAYNAATNSLIFTDSLNGRVRSIDLANSNQTSLYAGLSTYGGDGYMIPAGSFNSPYDTAINTVTGRLYIVDSGNCVIRMIDQNGYISTIAGNGSSGYANGPGATSQFSFPRGVAVDSARNYLYVTDTNNDVIRMIDLNAPDYTVSLVAGAAGNGSYAEGKGSAALFFNPEGIDVDPAANILYIADTRNNSIRQIDLNNGNQTALLAGSGDPSKSGYVDDANGANSRFTNPRGVAFSKAFNSIFVGDTDNNLIRRVSLSTAHPTSAVAGNGTQGYVEGDCSSAEFQKPRDLVMDSNLGILYVADSLNYRVRAIDLNVFKVSLVCGNGTSGYQEGLGSAAIFATTGGMGMDVGAQKIYIADTTNNRVRVIDVFVPTPTASPTYPPADTSTPTYGGTNTITPTWTVTPTDTPYYSPTITSTWTNTATVTETGTYTNTMTATPTYTATMTFTDTFTITGTFTATGTSTVTGTFTQSETATQTDTVTATGTVTGTFTITETATQTASATDTGTATSTGTITETFTASGTATDTGTATMTATETPDVTYTDTPTVTETASASPPDTATITPSDTPSITMTWTATVFYSPTQAATGTETAYATQPATPTITATIVDYYAGNYVVEDHMPYPNPSLGKFSITYTMSLDSELVKIDIYTVGFRKIVSVQKNNVPGKIPQSVLFDNVRNLANGTYFYVIRGRSAQGKETHATGELVIIK
jgi:DNA-binding beta-propeller fold protein YncE